MWAFRDLVAIPGGKVPGLWALGVAGGCGLGRGEAPPAPSPPARPVPRRVARSLETSLGSTGRGGSSEGGLSFHDVELS